MDSLYNKMLVYYCGAVRKFCIFHGLAANDLQSLTPLRHYSLRQPRVGGNGLALQLKTP